MYGVFNEIYCEVGSGATLAGLSAACSEQQIVKGIVVLKGAHDIDMDIKKKVFQVLEGEVSQDTIIASNTSSLSITEMATVLTCPERFIGMHFFSPVNRMPLVEVIRGDKTSDETVAAVVQLVKSLKKTPVVVKNCPGFLVNRILMPYINEAVLCLQGNASITQIDQLMTRFGMPVGPLTLADEVGLDVSYKVAKTLEEGYGDRMKLAPVFDSVISDQSLRGRKSKKGFYVYNGKKKIPNKNMLDLISSHQDLVNGKPIENDLLDRMVLLMINEAARCIEEGIVNDPIYSDMAMIMGTGFPPFHGGLCRYADQRGVSDIVSRMEDLATVYGDRFIPAPLLVNLAKKGKGFYHV